MSRRWETTWVCATSGLSLISAIVAACLVADSGSEGFLLSFDLPVYFILSLASLIGRVIWMRRRTQFLQRVYGEGSAFLLVWALSEFFLFGDTVSEISAGGIFVFFGLWIVMIDEFFDIARKSFIVTER